MRQRADSSRRGVDELLHELEQVDEAMAWMQAGVYGACSVCGAQLPAEQINETPEIMTCPSCSKHLDGGRGLLM